MTAPTAVRRVTVVAQNARVDVSLPAMSTIAELVPALVRITDAEKSGTGWRLARLGGEAFDASATIAGVGIRDGEILFLNPRSTAETQVVVDDVADTIAAAATPTLNWRPALTRGIGLACVVVAFAGTAVAVSLAAPAWPTATSANALLAAAMLLATAVVGRSRGDGGVATALAGAGAVAALLAGLGLLTVDAAISLDAAPIAAGCLGLAGYLMVAALAARAHGGWFIAGASTALTGCGAALVTAGGVRPTAVAAVLAAGAIAITPLLPLTALRLSRLGLPRVPADAAGFQSEEPPVNRTEVTEKTEAAARVLAALLSAIATVTVGAAGVLLLREPTAATRALAGAAGLALLLRSRAYRAAGQRAALVIGGAVVLALTVTSLALTGAWLLALGGGALLGTVGLAYALRAPANQPSPYWGRFLEVVEFFTVVSLVPLAAAVLDLYQQARAIA